MKILPIPLLTILPVSVMATVLCGCHATTAVEASSTRHPVVAPAGSVLRVRLNHTLATGRSRPGDRFNGVLDSSLLCGSDLILPKGTKVAGRVVTSTEVGQRAVLAVQLEGFQTDENHADESQHPVSANIVTRTAPVGASHAVLEADSIIGFTLTGILVI
jgi:hypothetical protein